jgi:VCBS repeat-containing protein
LIVGGDGSDNITLSYRSNNLAVGGKGNDVFDSSGWGCDENIFLFNVGDGQDTVNIGPYNHPATLMFGLGVDPTTVKVTVYNRVGWGGLQQDMLIQYGALGDSVFINGSIPDPGEGGGNVPAVRVKFSDGAEWNYSDLIAHAGEAVLPDTTGDRITADPHSPLLVGGSGNDTFVIGAQPAEYLIIDEGVNVVEFEWSLANLQTGNQTPNQMAPRGMNLSGPELPTVDPATYQISHGEGILTVQFANGISLRIDGYDPNDPVNSTSIKQFIFADGLTLSLEQLLTHNFGSFITNTAPVTIADMGAAQEDISITTSGNVLANDSDADQGSVLSVANANVLVGQYGALTLNVDGSYVYGLDNSSASVQGLAAGQTLSEIFAYEVTDGLVGTASSLTVTITGTNDAPVVTTAIADMSTDEDAAFSYTIPTGTFADIDQGDVLSYIATLADGTVLPSWLVFDAATQTFSGTPGNADVGALNVRVTATDLAGASVSAAFALDVINVNDAPVAADDAVTTSADVAATIAINNLLLNDSDIDAGDMLSLSSFDAVSSNGNNVVQDGNGYLVLDIGTRYQNLGAEQSAVDSFTYTVTDAAGATSTATVSVTINGVNDGPATQDDSVTLGEDASQAAIGNVLANDSDVDAGTMLQVANAGVLAGQYGQLTLNADGSYSYALNSALVQSLNAGQTVTESFSYQATDGLVSTPAVLTVTVAGANDAPVMADDMAAVLEEFGVTATGNVLANDSDVDQGTVLQVANAGVFAGQYGQLTLNADGSYIYVLDSASLNVQSLAAGQVVTETFAYQATDGIAITPSTLMVNITGTNTAPVVVADIAAVQEDIGTTATGNVLANDSDVDQGTVLQVANAGVFAGQFGTLTLNADGSYSYVLDNASANVQSLAQGQTVTETFAYQATDGIVTIPSTLTISITGTNDAPVVATAIATQFTNEDAAFSYTIPTGAFSDVDQGDVLSYSATLADGTALPSWLVFDAATQTFSGMPGNGEVGSYSITVTATDASGLAVSSSFSIDVANVNDAPVVSMAMADQSTLEDAPFSFTIPAGTFSDADFIHGDSLSYAVTLADGTALPAWLTFDAATQTFSGIPGNADVGTLNVCVTATDQAGASVAATFALDVVNVNDAPVAANDVVTASGTATVISIASLLANDYDIDLGDTFAMTGFDAITAAGNTVMQDASGNLVFDIGNRYQYLGTGQSTTDSFTYTVTDTAGATSTATVNVTITGTNDAPVVATDTAVVQEDFGITATGNVLANDSDADQGTVLTVANAGLFTGQYGQLALLADGSYTYQLDNASQSVQSLAAGQTVTDTFSYQATDGQVSTPSVLTVSIIGSNDAPAVMVDTAAVREDLDITTTGNVLANDSGVDQGSVLSVADAGTRQGIYGSLTLAADGSYNYTLDNASQAVQSLGRNAQVTEHFGYTVTDGIASTASGLDILISGSNDAPVLAASLTDHDVVFNKAFSWQMPEGSFTDIDAGDTLTYSATQANGTALPSWLTFDAATRTFAGQAPKKTGSIDVMVTATDVAADGSTTGSLAASDVFRITVEHGNEGVGNGEDAPPPGHDCNQNDGHGTSPGNPGSHDGHGHHSSDEHGHDNDHNGHTGESHANGKKDDCIDDLIRDWFQKGNTADRHGNFDELGRGDNRIDYQANRNVARGISDDFSKQWAQMNAKLKQHLEHSGNDDHFDSAASHGSPIMFGSGGAQGVSQLGKAEGVQMKSFAGLKEGLERLGC